jgi:hypothetical protein
LESSFPEFRAGSRTARSAAASRSPKAILDAVLNLGTTLRQANDGESVDLGDELNPSQPVAPTAGPGRASSRPSMHTVRRGAGREAGAATVSGAPASRSARRPSSSWVAGTRPGDDRK